MSSTPNIPISEKHFYILFSESDIGIHYKKSEQLEVFEVVSLTFPPKVEKIDNGDGSTTFRFKNNLKKNSKFRQALELYKRNKKLYKTSSFLIGYDDDEVGESMSEAMRENLLSEGVPHKDIFRMPLTEYGYVMIRSFLDTEKYKKYLYINDLFIQFQKKNGISKGSGFPKVFSLKYIMAKRGSEIKFGEQTINPAGTSTAVAVTNIILNEE